MCTSVNYCHLKSNVCHCVFQVLYIPSEERKKKAEKKKEVEMVVGSPPKDDRPRMVRQGKKRSYMQNFKKL